MVGGGVMCLALYLGAYYATVEIKLENMITDENHLDRRVRPTAWWTETDSEEAPEFSLKKQVEALEAYHRNHPPADEADSEESESAD
jgi:hypothetical protein